MVTGKTPPITTTNLWIYQTNQDREQVTLYNLVIILLNLFNFRILLHVPIIYLI